MSDFTDDGEAAWADAVGDNPSLSERVTTGSEPDLPAIRDAVRDEVKNERGPCRHGRWGRRWNGVEYCLGCGLPRPVIMAGMRHLFGAVLRTSLADTRWWQWL
jgi:hypothetical protein